MLFIGLCSHSSEVNNFFLDDENIFILHQFEFVDKLVCVTLL
jgi:hypothetical protein